MNGTLDREQSAVVGPYYRLTKSAAARAKTVLGLARTDELAQHLGISRRSFYRLRLGQYPITLNQAVDLCDRLAMPLTEAFERDAA